MRQLLVLILVGLLFSGLLVGLSLRENAAESSVSSLSSGTSYSYRVSVEGAVTFSYLMDVRIASTAWGRITAETSVRDEAVPEVRLTDTFDSATRVHDMDPRLSGWFWATPEDVRARVARFGLWSYALVGTRDGFVRFRTPVTTEFTSELQFRFSDLVLSTAATNLVADGQLWRIRTELLASESLLDGSGAEVPLAALANREIAPSALVVGFVPPYSQSGGWFSTSTSGAGSAFAIHSHGYSNGYLYNKASAGAGMPWGSARADAFAYIAGPTSMSFSLSQSRNYKFEFKLRLTGRADTSRSLCTFLGCMSAQSKISFVGKVFQVGGSMLTQYECYLYQAAGILLPKSASWSNGGYTCSWRAYAYAGNYWFEGDLYTVHTASNVLVGGASGSSELTAYMTNVNVYTA